MKVRVHFLLQHCLDSSFPRSSANLFELMGVKKTWKPKHTPAHAQVLEVMQSPELGAQRRAPIEVQLGFFFIFPVTWYSVNG